MIPLRLGAEDRPAPLTRTRRQRFGLDAPLPADPGIVQRAVLRYLAGTRPGLLVLTLERPASARKAAEASAQVDLAQGAPELLLVQPGGGLVFLAIRAQAHRPSRAERAFADLCRHHRVPFHIVRSLPEARRVLDQFAPPLGTEINHAQG